jgi:hypothetical protein
MNLMGRVFNGFLVLSALLFAVSSIPAEQLSELCALADRSGRLKPLREVWRQREKLFRMRRSIAERECCKQKIAEALNSGQLSLIEAAAYFRSLYEDPDSWPNPRRPRPQHDDGESWCREVIDWMEKDPFSERSSGEAGALHQRLEEELQEQLDCNGFVILPE